MKKDLIMTAAYPRDMLDDLLEATNAFADESYGMTGIDLLRASLKDFDMLAQLHEELHGVPMTEQKEATFRRLVDALIEYAGTPDDDNFNE